MTRDAAFHLAFYGRSPVINAKECNLRAAECAAKAASAPDESIGLEFLNLAARWRALAVRENFLGQLGAPGMRRED